jgi:hypothetical protein
MNGGLAPHYKNTLENIFIINQIFIFKKPVFTKQKQAFYSFDIFYKLCYYSCGSEVLKKRGYNSPTIKK